MGSAETGGELECINPSPTHPLCRLLSCVLESSSTEDVTQVRFNANGEWTPLQGAVTTEGRVAVM